MIIKSMRLVLVVILLIPIKLAAQVTGLAGWNIYVDPGHSQRENMGIYGYSEAEKVLRVALNLRELLLTTTDIDTVYLSRTNDQQYVTLAQRTTHANEVGAAWYHSIHSDASIVVPTPSNSTLLLWGQYRDGREKVPNGGKALSDIIVNVLTAGMRTTTRGSIGDCSFYGCSSAGPYLHVNRETTMPSELSEAGFHTNPVQNTRNMNNEWKRLEARTLFWSLLDFHNVARPPAGILTGYITDLESGIPINGATVKVQDQTYTTDTYESLFNKYSNDPNQLHNGFYYFENLPQGRLTMIVSGPSMTSDTSEVVVGGNFFSFNDGKTISIIPPRVAATTPAQGDTNFRAWNDIIIDFSRRMDPASVEAAIQLAPDESKTFVWANNNARLTVRTDTLAFETNYTLTISGSALGQFGQALDGNGDGTSGDDFVLSFKTGPEDVFPPVMLSVHPPNRATDVELQPIVNMIFDEEIDPASITEGIFDLKRLSDNSLAAGTLKHYVVNGQSLLTFFTAQELFANEYYSGRVHTGLSDLFGNATAFEKAFSFRTGNTRFELAEVDDFESDLTSNWWEPQRSGSTAGIVTEITNREAESQITNLISNSATSMKVDYGWDVAANSWLIRLYLGGGSPRQVLFNDDYLLHVYVFGDGSGNQFRFAVDDRVPDANAANHEVSPWYTIDWLGWRLVSWNMANDGTGTWIGDGNLDGTLRFDSIQLTYTPGGATSGILYFDDLRLAQKVVVSVEEPVVDVPREFTLYQNHPNPFNPETVIRYRIPSRQESVELAIYDLMGKRIKMLASGPHEAGDFSVQWNGRNEAGEAVASGTYLYRLTAGELSDTRRMILLR